MKKFYSPSTGGTYLEGIHGSMPADVRPISDERYQAVIASPAPGKILAHDADGLPVLIDPPQHEPTADERRAAVAAERYRRETAGVTVGGMPIDTGRDSQALITGAALAATLDSTYVCRWKTGMGFVELNAQQIIGMASTVRAHVQACFDREAALLAEIAAGTYSEAMLQQGWPS